MPWVACVAEDVRRGAPEPKNDARSSCHNWTAALRKHTALEKGFSPGQYSTQVSMRVALWAAVLAVTFADDEDSIRDASALFFHEDPNARGVRSFLDRFRPLRLARRARAAIYIFGEKEKESKKTGGARDARASFLGAASIAPRT